MWYQRYHLRIDGFNKFTSFSTNVLTNAIVNNFPPEGHANINVIYIKCLYYGTVSIITVIVIGVFIRDRNADNVVSLWYRGPMKFDILG